MRLSIDIMRNGEGNEVVDNEPLIQLFSWEDERHKSEEKENRNVTAVIHISSVESPS